MIVASTEPLIKVGLITGARNVNLALAAPYVASSAQPFASGDYTISESEGELAVSGPVNTHGSSVSLSPVDFQSSLATLHDVMIGIDFHWQRKESQSFRGTLTFTPDDAGITVINELPLESYLTSVISSEMSAECPPELLRAHAIVSRSWLLAQLLNERSDKGEKGSTLYAHSDEDELIRWYGRESHIGFDVCADDHCQRYQGISKAFSEAAFESTIATKGKVLTWGDQICDARYSKSCGGITEAYRAAWEDLDLPYLAAVYDGRGAPDGFSMPLSDHTNAAAWITSSPLAYCNTDSLELLGRILTGFDQETIDFYRWEVNYSQDELSAILSSRTGVDFGRVVALEPLSRGESGRITRLRISGEKRTLIIGKELEIRRALSRSHLYSSAFVVSAGEIDEYGFCRSFRLRGAGWGHGVGLCQIGAAVMAEEGRSHEEILAHYFRGAQLQTVY